MFSSTNLVALLVHFSVLLQAARAECNVDNCDLQYCSGDGCIKCEDGYYLSGTSCHQCQTSCTTCDSYSTCTECKRGWHGQTCNSECKTECLECSSFSQCSECIPGRYGSYCQHYCSLACIDILCEKDSGSCIFGCKRGYYINDEYCHPCLEQCARCANSSYCTECHSGYFGSDCQEICPEGCQNQACDKTWGTCTDGCAIGYYSEINLCLDCPYRCISCANESSCSECKTGFWGHNCQNDCQLTCFRCNKEDGTCIDGPPCNINDCDRNFCVNDSCIRCEDGYYLEGLVCKRCPQYCTKCSGPTTCTECVRGRYGSTCEGTCRDTCLDCTDFSECNECIRGRYGSYCQFYCPLGCIDILCNKDNGKCTMGCRHGHFYSGTDCEKCPDHCIRCSNTTDCTLCIPGYFGNHCQHSCPASCENHICAKESGFCTDGCSYGYFQEENSCISCPDRCSSCTDHNACIECKTGFWGQYCQHDCPTTCSKCTKEGTCIYDTDCTVKNCDVDYCVGSSCIKCLRGYHLSGTACSQCPDHCTECDGPSACTGCVSGRYGTICESVCESTCVDCVSSSHCTDCLPGRYGSYCELNCQLGCIDLLCEKSSGRCTVGCRHGYFLGDEDCTQCPEHCTRCTGSNYCTDCMPGYFGSTCQYTCPTYCQNHICDKDDGYCSDNCIEGYYSDETSCLSCPQRCYSCRDKNACIECKTGYWGTQCQYDCSFTCLRCARDGKCLDNPDCDIDNCDREYCLGSSCIKCKDGYYLFGTHCYECPSDCTKCSGPSTCSDCVRGRYGSECEYTCSSVCTDCISSSQCTECIPGRHGSFCQFYCPLGCIDITCEKDSGKCTHGCRHGHYLSQDDCIRCPEQCSRCEDGDYCTACVPGYFGSFCQSTCPISCTDQICDKTSGVCVDGCVDGYFAANNSCFKCPAWCVTCEDEKTCFECKSGRWGTHCQHDCPVDCISCTHDGECIDDGGIVCNIDHCERAYCSKTSCIRCEDGYYLSGTHCYQCNAYCTKCLSSTACSECIRGRYGPQCEFTCNSLCVDCVSSSSCTECIPGRYGTTCQSYCPLGCKNIICDKDSGSCIDGCRREFYALGENCNPCPERCSACSDSSHCTSCKPGFYGSSCQWTCQQGCENQVCHKDTGYCAEGCIDGYYLKDYCLRCPVMCETCIDHGNCTACKAGYWGLQCQHHCHDQCYRCTKEGHCIDYEGPSCNIDHCDNTYCHGDGCIKCDVGYYLYETTCLQCSSDCEQCSSSALCTKCVKGKYGTSCEYSCGSTCSDCINSAECTECIPGRYGSVCQQYCPLGCKDILCDKNSGKCTEGCRNGYFLNEDTCDECPNRCTKCLNESYCLACSTGFYGLQCHKACHEGCKDQLCQLSSGNCTNGCSDGYHLHRGYCVEDVVNEACQVAHCDKDNCFASTCALCEDGYHLEAFQCFKCPESCIECSSSNNCDECAVGRYGSVCQHHCASGCQDSICSKESGFCTEGCRTGYTMAGGECQSCPQHCVSCTSLDLCTNCEVGHWGRKCQYSCLGCSISGCQQNINCTHGCLDGHYANLIDIDQYECVKCPVGCDICTTSEACTICKPGFWGTTCNDSCNENCKGLSCHKNNGHCATGCENGYYGSTCSKRCSTRCETCTEKDRCVVCMAGRYGVMCEQTCSTNCFKYVCDRANATCSYGCSSGYSGDTCEQGEDKAVGRPVETEDGSRGAAVGLGVLLALAGAAIALLTVLLLRKRNAPKEEPETTPTMMNQTYDTRIGTADFYTGTRTHPRPYENTSPDTQATIGQGPFDIMHKISHYPTPAYNGSDKDYYEEAEYSSIKSSNDNIASF